MKIKFSLFLIVVILASSLQAQSIKDTKGIIHKVVKQTEQSTTDGWHVLTRYDLNHIAKIALPIGGIGTGTVSLGGRGDLRDWGVMNTVGKGYSATSEKLGYIGLFFALFTQTANGKKGTRVLQGLLHFSLYEGAFGSPPVNHDFRRFESCNFKAAYPFGQVLLSDKKVPLDIRIKAFNPLIPSNADASGILIAAGWDPNMDGVMDGCQHYSAVQKIHEVCTIQQKYVLSNGSAWGVCKQNGTTVEFSVHHVSIQLDTFSIRYSKENKFKKPLEIKAGEMTVLKV